MVEPCESCRRRAALLGRAECSGFAIHYTAIARALTLLLVEVLARAARMWWPGPPWTENREAHEQLVRLGLGFRTSRVWNRDRFRVNAWGEAVLVLLGVT